MCVEIWRSGCLSLLDGYKGRFMTVLLFFHIILPQWFSWCIPKFLESSLFLLCRVTRDQTVHSCAHTAVQWLFWLYKCHALWPWYLLDGQPSVHACSCSHSQGCKAVMWYSNHDFRLASLYGMHWLNVSLLVRYFWQVALYVMYVQTPSTTVSQQVAPAVAVKSGTWTSLGTPTVLVRSSTSHQETHVSNITALTAASILTVV